MLRANPRRRRGGRRTPGIAGPPVLRPDMVEHPGEVRLNEGPRPHVLRLLLAPHRLGLGKPRQLLDQRPRWEGIKLLHAQQIDVVKPTLLALLVKIVIDLA